MIALLGHPPPELVEKYLAMRGFKWDYPFRREDGELCDNADQFFGGPFFDGHGMPILCAVFFLVRSF